MTQWQRCQCTVKHTDKNGRKTDCGLLFPQSDKTHYVDCFECWVKTHPTRVKKG